MFCDWCDGAVTVHVCHVCQGKERLHLRCAACEQPLCAGCACTCTQAAVLPGIEK